ncbi:MAG: hypothetical protein CMH83_23835 [Nocardioides sp.]|nr:hypothetical protein [Nocardioides sp.]
MDSILRTLGKIPGALLIVPLFLAAVINTFFPQVLDIGSFTSALFRDGAVPLIGMFFFVMGSQIQVRSVGSSLEKGIVMLLGKYAAAIAVGLGVAYLTPDGTLFGLVPLAIIAAMGNSNGALYIALTEAPKLVHVVEALPTTAYGKVTTPVLRQLLQDAGRWPEAAVR